MAILGIIGIGTLGASVGRLAVQAGWEIILANSRAAWTAWPTAAALGPAARAGEVMEVVRAGDLVLLAIPLSATFNLPRDAFNGKIVIDAMNWISGRDEQFVRDGPTSAAVQRRLPGACVVKAFNNISFPSLQLLGRPTGAPDRSALPVAGDDRMAVEAVSQFVDEVGYDPVDSGSLAESWRFEPGMPSFVRAYAPDGDVTSPRPASAAMIQSLLQQALRPTDIDDHEIVPLIQEAHL